MPSLFCFRLLLLLKTTELLLASRQSGHLRIEHAEKENNTKRMHLLRLVYFKEDGGIARLSAGHLHTVLHIRTAAKWNNTDGTNFLRLVLCVILFCVLVLLLGKIKVLLASSVTASISILEIENAENQNNT